MVHRPDTQASRFYRYLMTKRDPFPSLPEHRIAEPRRSGAPSPGAPQIRPDGGNATSAAGVEGDGRARPRETAASNGGHAQGRDGRRQRVLVLAAPGQALDRLCLSLTTYGMQVAVSHDGLFALMSATLDPPSIVFIAPPIAGMPAASVARLLNTDERTAHVPVVMLQPNALPALKDWRTRP